MLSRLAGSASHKTFSPLTQHFRLNKTSFKISLKHVIPAPAKNKSPKSPWLKKKRSNYYAISRKRNSPVAKESLIGWFFICRRKARLIGIRFDSKPPVLVRFTRAWFRYTSNWTISVFAQLQINRSKPLEIFVRHESDWSEAFLHNSLFEVKVRFCIFDCARRLAASVGSHGS